MQRGPVAALGAGTNPESGIDVAMLKMGFWCIVAFVVILAVLTSIVSKFNKNAAIKAYRLLESGIDLAFAPEDVGESPAQPRVKRGYISPFTKKLCGSRQHWKCAKCG